MSLKKLLILAAIMLSAFAADLSAQTKAEKQIADAVENLRQAMIDGDGAKLEKIASDKLSYGHSGGLIENKSEFIRKLVSGASDFVTIDLSEQTIAVSGDTAKNGTASNTKNISLRMFGSLNFWGKKRFRLSKDAKKGCICASDIQPVQ